MSDIGIKMFAEVLDFAQRMRGRLLSSGTSRWPLSKYDLTDIRLAQMLDEMKDVVKDEFAKLTVHPYGRKRR